MALQFSLSPSPSSFLSSSPSPSLHHPVPCYLNRSIPTSTGSIRRISKRDPVRSCSVRSSLDTTAVPTVGQVTEVNKDTFWPLVKGAGSKVVVLDMYTQWCGPCKVIAPKFQKLAEKDQDVVFMKLDCNQENKALAKELGIKVVPTFKILKDSKVVKEVTGAKFDDLVFAIDTVKSSS